MPSITVSLETLARMVEVYVGRGETTKLASLERNLEGMNRLFKPAWSNNPARLTEVANDKKWRAR